MLDVSLLGTGGMMPLPNRWLTSLLLRYNGKMMLIDCGEGTQISMKEHGFGFKNLNTICITHFHADHIAGLPGLLLTLGNSEKKDKLKIIGPTGIKKIVESLLIIARDLPFEIEYEEIYDDKIIKEDDFIIRGLALDHRINCYGYNIEILRGRKFNVNKALKLDLPKKYWNELQEEKEVEYNGSKFIPDMVLGKERKGFKITYCTDTRPVKGLVDFAKGSDIFICEGMFAREEKRDRAKETRHMMFDEAADLAYKAKVKELWLTHFSPALTKPEEFKYVAKNKFKNTVIGKDHLTKKLTYKGE